MCDCIQMLNETLGESNAALVTTMFGKPQRCVVSTYKLDSKKRGRVPVALASFCPFCGDRYEAAAPSTTEQKAAA